MSCLKDGTWWATVPTDRPGNVGPANEMPFTTE
jgi:hypothetical protein